MSGNGFFYNERQYRNIRALLKTIVNKYLPIKISVPTILALVTSSGEVSKEEKI